MKFQFVVAALAAVVLAGCASVSSRVQERFTPVAPHTRVFPFERKIVYEAAQQTVKNVGLLLGRKSFAQGVVEGHTPIRSGDGYRDTRQTTIQVRLTDADDGGTQVDLLVSEQTEGSFPGGVSEQPLREHSLYELYFTGLQQVLAEKTPHKPPEKS